MGKFGAKEGLFQEREGERGEKVNNNITANY